jgi:predicted dehydrogenase
LKTAAVAASPATLRPQGANERVNVAVVGFHGQGMEHIRAYVRMPNVKIVALCDVDERLFANGVSVVERLAGYRPETQHDMRRLLDRKDIDAFSIATPDYWHAIQTIWACQAGKDVYIEKPVSFTITEGRRMVQAARKYKRIVQAGHNLRSEPQIHGVVRYLHEKKLGTAYRALINIVRPRASIGRVQESSIPEGVHWDLFLGPSPYRAFTTNRFHYGWHYFWDTGPTDVGNIGVHNLDVVRWGLNRKDHPVKVHSTGGYYVWDSDQETPNFQVGTLEYADGMIVNFDHNNLYSPNGQGTVFFTSEGYIQSATGAKWNAMRGSITPRTRNHPAGVDSRATNASFPDASYAPGPAIEPVASIVGHFENFIACVRSRKVEDLYCDIEEGHLSSSMAHLAKISYRTGRKLVFDPKTETFGSDKEANQFLTRKYREPYVLPEKI